MLIVVAIIAVLSTMAIPVLKKSKEQGKDVFCTNNLRQLAFAVSIYSHENPDYPQGFCGDPDCHPSIPYDKYIKLGTDTNDWQNSWWWFHFLKDVIEDNFSKEGPLWCPSRHFSDAELSRNILCGNYGINYSICKISTTSPVDQFSGKPLRSEQVCSPASKLLLMDSGYALISWKAFALDSTIYAFENPSRQDSYYLPGATVNKQRFENGSINKFQQEDAISGRHSGKFNAAFADGHVDKKSPSSVEPDWDTDRNISGSSFWSP